MAHNHYVGCKMEKLGFQHGIKSCNISLPERNIVKPFFFNYHNDSHKVTTYQMCLHQM